MLSYKKDKPELLYCFFEGKDDVRYYGWRIEHLTNREFKSFVCNGKDRSKSIIRILKTKIEYSGAKIIFFIDKDYSSDTSIDNVYVTPGYSIENFYTSTAAFKKVLEREFNINSQSDDYKCAVTLYLNAQEKFHKNVLLFNSWLACQSKARDSTGVKTFLNIDPAVNSYFSSIVKGNLVDINDYTDLNNHSYIESKLFCDAPSIEHATLNNMVSSMKSENSQKVFRGKFEIKFLVSFSRRLKDELCKKNSVIFNDRHKCTFVFDQANAVSTLSQFADTPECLKTFLYTFKAA